LKNLVMPSAAELDEAIAAEEARLAELDRLSDIARGRLVELRAARERVLREVDDEPTRLGPLAAWSAERKVALFASLFRGREDVFPLRWENKAKGRSGWAPRCSNEWVRGICAKPRVRCGECSHQAFLAPADEQLLAHLQGRQVMGVYPLLADDTCWLLAIDLDGASWRSDVRALRETCAELGVLPAVERSRSGDGAHLWFFFSAPVPAVLARRFGLMILTDAMGRCSTLDMASYDRLFPSQDTLPKGGFGNLIALPLQHRPRRQGNSLFVDEQLEPYEDQWSYLEALPRIEPDRLEALVAQADTDGGVLGMAGEEVDSQAPWRPPRSLSSRLAATTMPDFLRATLAQRLYVRTDGLPPVLADAMRRLATFSNPLFLERQRLRLSTGRTPRVIACFERQGRFLVLPRGSLLPLKELADDLGVRLELSDKRADGIELDVRFTGELTDAQADAARVMLTHELGVLCAPPGIGKTVIAAHLIAARGRSTLVIVHSKPLLEQWVQRLTRFLNVDVKLIGSIGAGNSKPNGYIDVATVQSLVRKENMQELLADYGHVVVDECHHVPAVTAERVLRSAAARFVTGLTATPYRRDGHHPIIAMQCGPIRHKIDRTGEDLHLRIVRRETTFDPGVLPTDAGIQEIYGALGVDERRTELIVNDALQLTAEGRSPIILTERREHLQRLAARLRDRVPVLIELHGEMRPRARRAAVEQLATTSGDTARVVLATGRYIGEGFDDSRLDTLLLAMPIAWKGTVVQYAGASSPSTSRQAGSARLRLRRRRVARAAPHVRQALEGIPRSRLRVVRDMGRLRHAGL
jgi:superfamily II DNA or RNA helicase